MCSRPTERWRRSEIERGRISCPPYSMLNRWAIWIRSFTPVGTNYVVARRLTISYKTANYIVAGVLKRSCSRVEVLEMKKAQKGPEQDKLLANSSLPTATSPYFHHIHLLSCYGPSNCTHTVTATHGTVPSWVPCG